MAFLKQIPVIFTGLPWLPDTIVQLFTTSQDTKLGVTSLGSTLRESEMDGVLGPALGTEGGQKRSVVVHDNDVEQLELLVS
jgi:hypothetical protein